MTIYVVQTWFCWEGKALMSILTDEAEALSVVARDEADRLLHNAKVPPAPGEEEDEQRDVRSEGTIVTCWRFQAGRYVKDETWPGVRS